MGFANAGALLGLGSLALAVTAHLFGAGAERRHLFSATRFLRAPAAVGRGRRRLRDLWPLCVRLLLLLAVVGAASGPRVTAPGAAAGAGGGALALVLDFSPAAAYLGADQAPLWQRARDDAAAQLAAVTPGTWVSLRVVGALGGEVDEPATVDVPRLQEVLRGLRGPGPGWPTPSAGAAAQAARAQLAARGPGGRLVAMGPFVARGWPTPAAVDDGVQVSLVDAARRLHADGRVLDAPLPPLENLAVVDLEVVAEGPDAEGPADGAATEGEARAGARVRVRLHNHGRHDVAARALTLTLGGQVVQRTVVRVAAGAVHAVELTVPALPQARTPLRAELAADAADGYRADDAFVRYVRAERPLRVLGVAGAGPRALDDDASVPDGVDAATRDPETPLDLQGPLHFVERALAHPTEAAAAVAFRACVPGALAEELQAAQRAGAPVDVVLLADVPNLAPASAAALAEHVGRGGGVFTALGEGVAAATEEQGAQRPPWLPCSLRELADAEHAQGRAAQLGPIDFAHPVLRGLDPLVAPSLAAARVRRFVHVEGRTLGPRDAVLRLEGGAPLVVAQEGAGAGGRRLLYTSGLDLTWSDVPLRSAFVPLVQQLVRWSGHALAVGVPEAVRTGEAFWAYLPQDAGQVRLRGTDENTAPGAKLGETVAAAGGAARLVAPLQPGTYVAEARAAGAWRALERGFLAVNPAADESNLGAAAPEVLQAYAGAPAGATRHNVGGGATGAARDYAPVLWLLALGLAILEAALSCSLSPKNALQVGVVPRLLSWFLRLRPALRTLRRTRVM